MRPGSGRGGGGGDAGEGGIQAGEDAVGAEDFEEVIEAGSEGFAGAGEADGVDEGAGFEAEFAGDGFEGGFEGGGVEGGGGGEGVAEALETGVVFGDELFGGGVGVGGEVVAEVEFGVGREFSEEAEFAFAGSEGVAEVGFREAVEREAGLEEGLAGEREETVVGELAGIFAVEPGEFFHIEPGVVAKDMGEVEHGDGVREGKDFAVAFGGPAEEAEVIGDGLREVEALEVGGHGGAGIAFAHFGPVLVEDEGDVGVAGRFGLEGAEEGDVFGCVAEVVFAADDVSDLHFEVVDDVNEVEDGLAVGANDDEVGVGGLAVGEFAADLADHGVTDEDGFAGHAELDGAFVFVGVSAVDEFPDAAAVKVLALGLEVGAAVASARAGRVGGGGAFVPVEAEPAEALEDDVDGGLGVAGGVGVFDAEDEGAAGVAGVEPVEKGRAGASDVEVASGAGGETDADVHRHRLAGVG